MKNKCQKNGTCQQPIYRRHGITWMCKAHFMEAQAKEKLEPVMDWPLVETDMKQRKEILGDEEK